MFNRIRRAMVRSNGAASYTSPEPINRDTLREIAPSVFAAGAHDSRSDRYTYVPTIQIVDYLEQNGYGVYSVMQSGSRDESRRGHTKHMLRVRPINQTLTVGGTHPEIVLVNSHDGSSAYRLMAGLFRLVCSNGLIVSQSVIDDYRVRHNGEILADIAVAVEKIRTELPAIGGRVEQFQRIALTQGEREVFGRAALAVKYGSTEAAPIDAATLTAPIRREDSEPTLWNTLNTIQEGLIRGGHRYRLHTDRGVQRRRTGAVGSVDGVSTINRAVWQLAEEMAKLKA